MARAQGRETPESADSPAVPMMAPGPSEIVPRTPPRTSATLYALVDPRDGRVRYFGRTTQRLGSRLACHVGWARDGRQDTPKTRWIRDLLAVGLRPRIVALATVAAAEAPAAERALLAAWPGNLTNARLRPRRISC